MTASPGAPKETGRDSVRVVNRSGASPYVIVCDHASNAVPAAYGTLGLDPSELARHIAWDPGALAVAEHLSAALDAPLVASCISRLVVDCNRAPDAPDLIAVKSEDTEIPGNRGLTPEARAARLALAHTPFHAAIDAVVAERVAAGHVPRVVSIHSFTPVYRGKQRPWHIGILHDDDERLAKPLIHAFKSQPEVSVGDNEPYSPADGVYYTLERHARSRGLPCVMIELRSDEIADEIGQRTWGELLSGMFSKLEPVDDVRERRPGPGSTERINRSQGT